MREYAHSQVLPSGRVTMPLRPCIDCGTPTSGTRCAKHTQAKQRQRDQRRGTTTQRSYGTKHQKRRAELLPLAIGKPCPRCGEPMLATQVLDLGHSKAWMKKAGLPGDRIEHADCNRRAGGISAHTPEGIA